MSLGPSVDLYSTLTDAHDESHPNTSPTNSIPSITLPSYDSGGIMIVPSARFRNESCSAGRHLTATSPNSYMTGASILLPYHHAHRCKSSLFAASLLHLHTSHSILLSSHHIHTHNSSSMDNNDLPPPPHPPHHNTDTRQSSPINNACCCHHTHSQQATTSHLHITTHSRRGANISPPYRHVHRRKLSSLRGQRLIAMPQCFVKSSVRATLRPLISQLQRCELVRYRCLNQGH